MFEGPIHEVRSQRFMYNPYLSLGMPNMGGMENAGGAAMFGGAQEIGGQMGSPMGGSMQNVLQGAIGGGMPGAAQKRTKMGKVHKLLSKLSKRKEIKKHHHKH